MTPRLASGRSGCHRAEVEGPEPLGIEEDVDLGDRVAAEGERHDGEGPIAGEDHEAWRTVDSRPPGAARDGSERQRLARDSLGAPDLALAAEQLGAGTHVPADDDLR